jgi:hypothetical protein
VQQALIARDGGLQQLEVEDLLVELGAPLVDLVVAGDHLGRGGRVDLLPRCHGSLDLGQHEAGHLDEPGAEVLDLGLEVQPCVLGGHAPTVLPASPRIVTSPATPSRRRRRPRRSWR